MAVLAIAFLYRGALLDLLAGARTRLRTGPFELATKRNPGTSGDPSKAASRNRVPDGDDLVSSAFGSQDFRDAVAAFGSGRVHGWTGR